MIRLMRPRYLDIKVESDEFLDEDEFKNAIWNSILQLFGEYGASKAGLLLAEYEKDKRRAVLRCSHKALPLVHASVVTVTKIGDKPVALHILRISGTLKALLRKRGTDP